MGALVSQKFTFSVIVTQKSFSQRNVSFQVNEIVALYGKQSYIPKPLVMSPDSNQQGIVNTPSESSVPRGDEQETPQKKARLAMITIPCKALILEGNKSQEESSQSALLGDDSNKTEPVRQPDEAECDKRTVDHPEPMQLAAPSVTLHMAVMWKTSVQSITPDQSSPVQLIPPSVTLYIAEKVPPIDHSGSKAAT